MVNKKERIWRGVFMLPWIALMVLYFIWANEDGFNISKTAFGILLTTFTSVLWYAIACLISDIFVSDE